MDISQTFDIKSKVNELKIKAINNRKKLLTFLETIPITDLSINDYIVKYLIENEDIKQEDYTYWIDGGFSWFLNYTNFDFDEITDELLLTSLTPLNLKIHYIYTNETSFENKINEIRRFLNELKGLITNVNTNIIEKEIDRKELFKQHGYNLKLVIDNSQKGGGKFKKEKKRFRYHPFKSTKIEGSLPQLPSLKKLLYEQLDINDLINDDFNSKIIVDFYIEDFSSKSRDISDFLPDFKKNYLLIPRSKGEFLKGFKELNLSRLNRLNDFGLITYSLLNKINIEDEFNLNVDNYRQKFFEETYEKNQRGNIRKLPYIDFLQELLERYEKNFKKFQTCYNTFFIENLKEIINKKKDPNYELFKDVIDRWFVSKFRPSINSFILEINDVLNSVIGIKLFIAGGDAMRRFENEISFTKDIDTKLYIGNVDIQRLKDLNLSTFERILKTDLKLDDDEIHKIINKLRLIQINSDEKKVRLLIKDMVVGIIVKNIVKLRNYLQENIRRIFQDLLQYDIRTADEGFGTKVIKFKMNDGRIFKIDILLNESDGQKFQQFRTRENKKRVDFPVDLYSIDFRIYINEFDSNDNLLNKKSHDISILDVVLQDVDDFYDYYIDESSGIPVASLKFLKDDIEKTFASDRAYARISSGKVVKDISRYEKIKELYKYSQKGGNLNLSNLNDVIINFDRTFSNRPDLRNFRDLLIGLRDNKTIDLKYFYANKQFFKGNIKRFNQIKFNNPNIEIDNKIKEILIELYHNSSINQTDLNRKIEELYSSSIIDYLQEFINKNPADITDAQILLDFLRNLRNLTPEINDRIKSLYTYNRELVNPIFFDNSLREFIDTYPELKLFFTDFFFFKKNFHNEDLAKTDENYFVYQENTQDEIINIYYDLFYKLCSMDNNDGLLRHVILFANGRILGMYNSLNPSGISRNRQTKQIKSVSKRKKSPSPPPLPPPPVLSKRGRIITKTQSYKPSSSGRR